MLILPTFTSWRQRPEVPRQVSVHLTGYCCNEWIKLLLLHMSYNIIVLLGTDLREACSCSTFDLLSRVNRSSELLLRSSICRLARRQQTAAGTSAPSGWHCDCVAKPA